MRRAVWAALLGIAAGSGARAVAAQDDSAGTLSEARQALEHGEYAAARQAFHAHAEGSHAGLARLGLARVQLATGRYDEAARTAANAARSPGARAAARTLQAEAHMARGRLEKAEKLLERVLRDAPDAYRARIQMARLLQRQGRVAEGESHAMRLIQAYNAGEIGRDDAPALSYVALAAWQLGSVQDANAAFREAAAADDERVETQLWWARLFLEKYDTRNAAESIRTALRVNPNSARAHALMAELVLEDAFDFDRAEQETRRALEINPNLVKAHVTVAGMALRNLDFPHVEASLKKALQVDPHDLRALSVRAAARLLQDDEAAFARAQKEVLQRHATYSRMYSIIARYAEWEHRYPRLVELARKALALNPDDARAHATLGLNLLRMGEEKQGLEALRDAWDRDPFNVQVYNVLNLYDDVIGKEYEQFDAAPFRFRMHEDERALLQPLVVPVLREAYRDMRRRYGFKPDGPVHMELYADREHFSVRTTGLPNTAVQGVCFGKVVTALSPAGGPFNWGQITWHELSHVFHIQLSRNRVPRWFTEGLAEYETLIAREHWRREQDHTLWQALQAGTLPPLRRMNQAFTHADSLQEMMSAYYASSMLVQYIAERFGFEKIVGMLRAWGKGKPTEDVVAGVLGLSIDALDAEFRAHEKQRLQKHAGDFFVRFERYHDLARFRKRAERAPDDALAQAELAAAHYQAGEREQAEDAASHALGLNDAQPIAHFVLARLAVEAKDAAEARAHLQAIVASGRDGYAIRMLLGHGALTTGKPEQARQHFDAAVALDPNRHDAWQALAMLGKMTDDVALRRRALERLTDLDQHGRQPLEALMRLLAKQKQWKALAGYSERVRFVDPGNAESHRLLAEAFLHLKQARQARQHIEMATRAGHPEPEKLAETRAKLPANQGR